MIKGLRPYPATTVTSVPWLDRIPAHWKLQRGKWLFKKMDRPVRDADEVVTCFRDGTVTLRKNRRLRGFTESLKEIGYQGIRRGDLVIHAMDAFAGAIGVADCDGKGTPVYSVCQPGPTSNSFYFALLLREMARNQWIQALAKGIRERSTDFRFNDFGSLVMPLPPLPEQDAIVRFLGHGDQRIRRYIRAKQKLIKLLDEQKQTIINRAVTRGVVPNVRLVPSGVEWLGEVPEHWKLMRLKNVATVQTGLTLGKNYGSALTKRYPYLRVANVQTGRVDLRTVKEIDVPESEALGCLLKAGDVLMTEGGDIDKLGRGCVWNNEIADCLHQNHVFAVRCGTPLLPEFLVILMASAPGRYYFQSTAKQTTNLAATNSTTLKEFPSALPSIDEQRWILSSITTEASDIDRTKCDAEREIALLCEYRARLIADVVTGKLDVREVAAQLPDETEDFSPLDHEDAEISDEEGADITEELAPIEA